ncbi:F-box family protein [Rhynchospora pubera]|uniref:F-box family protein n=1 Tax=Rhynchospora pubera TaxID=906938 RepID=A0AAV8F591_9POAL|nr:F-box family protein [Rhynchospora pubera]
MAHIFDSVYLGSGGISVLHWLLSRSRSATCLTSLFNKKWKNLWTLLPHLYFDSREFESDARFCDFVDTMLSRRETHLEKFELWCKQLGQHHYASIQRWIHYAVQHKTKVLRVNVSTTSVVSYCIFNSESLEEMDLVSEELQLRDIREPTFMVNLPRLRKLRLEGAGFWLVDGFLEKLLSGCPVLEDLSLSLCGFNLWEPFSLLTKRLKSLTIAKFPGAFIQSNSAPNRKLLYYSRSVEGLARVINLELSSLVNMNMFFHVVQPLEIECYLGSILSGISNVEMLQLCLHIPNPEFDLLGQLTLSSTLGNLKHLSICGFFERDGFYYLSALWQYLPNLKELTLQQCCQGCPFIKDRVKNWKESSCIVLDENMEVWGKELAKCRKLKKVDVRITKNNDKVQRMVHALLKCWGDLKDVHMCIMSCS